MATSWERERTPIVLNALRVWLRTVFTLRPNESAISAADFPAQMLVGAVTR